MDKLKQIIKRNKKSIIFLFILTIIALITGSLFGVILNDADKQIVQESINQFLTNSNKLNYIGALKTGTINQTIFIIIIWLLGFSIIGIPIILFSFFLKVFVLGFSITSLITIKGTRGCLISLAYIFPHHVLNIVNYTFLTIISLKVSFSLLYAIIKRKKIDFKPIINKYLLSLLISLILGLIAVLLEVYLMPFLIQFFY